MIMRLLKQRASLVDKIEMVQKNKSTKIWEKKNNNKQKVKGPDILYIAAYRETRQQQFTSGVLTGTSIKRRGAISPNERTLDPQSAARPMPQPPALWPSPRDVLRQ